MPEDSGKYAEKIGAFAAPGAQVNIGTQIINGQKQLTPTKYIPRGSVHFVGRETELTMLHEDLQRRDYVAIAGMGGVGKTELATQYARRYQEDYGGITWFNDRETNLAAEVLEFFRLQYGFEIPQKLGERLLSLKEQVAWCWSKYPNSALPILIVFDDVTNLANLREVVPDVHRFRVLVTTRLRHLDPNFIQEIPLDVLSPQKEPGKALELLKGLLEERDRRVENQPQAAIAILCECLEYLPLGIELVGGYLVRDPEMSLDMMFGRLQERKLAESALQDRETLKSTQLGVKAAFALTWSELDPLAQQLGRFLSLFSPALILWDLVIWVAIGGEEAENQEERQLTWSEDELNKAKKQLYGRNLLQLVEEKEGYYKIHALVRWFLQEELANSGETKLVLETTFTNAMIAVAQILPNSPTSKQIGFFSYFVSHLEDLAQRLIAEINKRAKETQLISLALVPNDEVIWVFVGIGRFYEGQGLYKLAQPWREQCLNVSQALFNGDHPHVTGSLNNLALLYNSQGRYSQAEYLYIQALEIRRRLFNSDHFDLATSLNNLAGLYHSQGQYSQAEPLLTQALEMRRRLFNSDHPDVATSLNNLAGLYHSQGRYNQAELLYTQALEMTKQLFDGDHPDVATSLNNLAKLYDSQGRYSQAELLYTQALEMTKQLFDDDHPDVATSLNNLAFFYNSQRRYSQAKPLLTQALEMRKRLFDDDHPDVAGSLNNLALLYNSQGRYSQANLLYIQALEMRKRLFNGDHPDVATSLNNLALFYDSQGWYNQAELLYTQALEMTKRLFDGDHPDVATILNNLAGLYYSQGRYSEAEPLYTQALAMSDRIFGVNHPTTATIRENLTILQRQSTPHAIWKHRSGQFVQILIAMLILPFYLLWRSLKRLIRN
ncbi:tetratricopeptide repeat protein [Nostoc sp.]|uniref:tetratricopeptide repeat protein n=1 Tax=Nostoc sp. TaxID=1180 RepID=UPI003035B751